jgi:hypothetical protein
MSLVLGAGIPILQLIAGQESIQVIPAAGPTYLDRKSLNNKVSYIAQFDLYFKVLEMRLLGMCTNS